MNNLLLSFFFYFEMYKIMEGRRVEDIHRGRHGFLSEPHLLRSAFTGLELGQLNTFIHFSFNIFLKFWGFARNPLLLSSDIIPAFNFNKSVSSCPFVLTRSH